MIWIRQKIYYVGVNLLSGLDTFLFSDYKDILVWLTKKPK